MQEDDVGPSLKGELPAPLRPERVASDAIRGYVHQAIATAMLWLDLGEREVLVCEGDEDCDRHLFDEEGCITSVELTQIKALKGNVSARDRSVAEVIANFLIEFAHHEDAGRTPRFVFATTAGRATQRLGESSEPNFDIDVLEAWQGLSAVAEAERAAALANLQRNVHKLLEAEAVRLSNLDRGSASRTRGDLQKALEFVDANATRWHTFLSSVTWKFDEPALVEGLEALERRLSEDPRTKHLPANQFAARLVIDVLRASTQREIDDRALTLETLEKLAAESNDELRRWADAHHVERLAAWASRLDAVEEQVGQVQAMVAEEAPRAVVCRISERARNDLKQRSRLRLGEEVVHIERAVVERITDAVRKNSLLVVGPPGIGKSGVLYDVHQRLTKGGVDTLLVHGRDLVGQRRRIRDAIEGWIGEAPAVLLVDGVDAVREGTLAGELADLLVTLAKMSGRWHIVASIRDFDLDHDERVRSAFPAKSGSPTSARHLGIACVEIAPLESEDLAKLAVDLPELGAFIASAPPDLEALLHVPFHLQLACRLIDTGVHGHDLTAVSTRSQLLDEYWQHRVDDRLSGTARDALIYGVCERMVTKHALVASRRPPLPESRQLSELLSAGVFVEPSFGEGTADTTRIEFSHQALFEYALARVWLPADGDELATLLAERPELVLFARPSLDLYFERLWFGQENRERFWRVTLTLCAAEAVPEVARIVGPGVCVQRGPSTQDLDPLVQALHDARPGADRALSYVNLALRGSEHTQPAKGAWDDLALEAISLERLWPRDVGRLMMSTLLARNGSSTALGEAARILFDVARSDEQYAIFWPEVIRHVCMTASTNVPETASRIRTLIAPASLADEGYRTLFLVANQIPSLLVDPPLVHDVYVAAFSAPAQSDKQFRLGHSRILGLSQSRRNSYDTALYSLCEAYSEFVKNAFDEATEALFEMMDAEAAGQFGGEYPRPEGTIETRHGPARVIEDFQYMHPRPDSNMARMKDTWLAHATVAVGETGVADALLKRLAAGSWTGTIVVRTLCELGVRAANGMDAMTCVLESPDVYRLLGLRYAATEWLRVVFPTWEEGRRSRVERALLKANEADGDGGLSIARTFGAIADHLVTREALELVAEMRADGPLPPNRPPVSVRRGGVMKRHANDYLREMGIDPDAEPNKSLLASASAAADAEKPVAAALKLRADLLAAGGGVDPIIQNTVWQAILEGITRASGTAPSHTDASELLSLATSALGAPATHIQRGAVEALSSLWHIEKARDNILDAYQRLVDHELPEVRWATLHAVADVAGVAGEVFWQILEERIEAEDDPVTQGVLTVTIVSAAINVDPVRALVCAEKLLSRLTGDVDCERLEARGWIYRLMAERFIAAGDATYGAAVVGAAFEDMDEARDETLLAARPFLDLPWTSDAAARRRSVEMMSAAVAVALPLLRPTDTPNGDEIRRAVARLDLCARELQFAAVPRPGANGPPRSDDERRAFLDLTETLVRDIASSGVPSVVHHIIEALQFLLPADPVRVYPMIADAVSAGAKHGYQNEGLAADRIVAITAQMLSEHRALVQQDRMLQTAILDVLGAFVSVGWPQANALTIELANIWR
ncbi:MAG: hypothetical protein GXP55_21390 [Deltaproteobacteria bacterium]|nr:hypothetical protein [Deltaproteobacteria bacterium]